MATTSPPLDNRSKAVVAFLDRRRLKGYIYNFSPLKDRFRLFPHDNPLQTQGTDVELKDLKAIFFVKDFTGNPDSPKSPPEELHKRGRKAEITFPDGEVFVGTTDAYNPKKLGFFVAPLDPMSNNLRVFVIIKNIHQLKWL